MRRTLIILLILIIVSLIIYFGRSMHETRNINSTAKIDVIGQDGNHQTHELAKSKTNHSTKSTLAVPSDKGHKTKPPVSSSKSVQQNALDVEASRTKSRIEKHWEWASQVGFATPLTDSEYAPLSVDELLFRAERGDLTASYWAGLKLAQSGDLKQAREVLIDAVAHGSIGAAKLLHEIYMGYQHNDPDISEAIVG